MKSNAASETLPKNDAAAAPNG